MLKLWRRIIPPAIRIGKNFANAPGKDAAKKEPPQKEAAKPQEHTLPPLPYKYNDLEPIICCEIMELHHTKHHASYVKGLNEAEAKIREAICQNPSDFATIISLSGDLKFHGGGHINHTLFWENLSPCGGQPSDEFRCAIVQDFGTFDNLIEKMSQLAISVQGSGWAWLGFDPSTKRLKLEKCLNQDPLQATTGLIPLLGFDVWEHAYYLQYKNLRADYVTNLWSIVNWVAVTERYNKAKNPSQK